MQLSFGTWQGKGGTIYKGKFNNMKQDKTPIELEIQSTFIDQ
ncbi:hypothetical protein [Flavobacterium cellulosilyticum]|nr:hypothetical protein [Flavobacterium cellulosilyticum]